MDKVSFTPNVPQQVALKFPDGRLVEGRFGDQMMYTLASNQVMYLDVDVAARINLLGVRKGEPFCVCKRWSGKKGDPVQWDVWRPEPGQQRAQLSPTPAAAPTPAESTGISETQLEAEIRAEILARKVAGASVSAPAPAVTAASQPPAFNHNDNNGNGSKPNGANGNGVPPANGARPYNAAGIPTPPVKIPMNVAVTEAVRMVQSSMKETGEQWSDQSRQDLVSTILITGQREGWIAIWERQAR